MTAVRPGYVRRQGARVNTPRVSSTIHANHLLYKTQTNRSRFTSSLRVLLQVYRFSFSSFVLSITFAFLIVRYLQSFSPSSDPIEQRPSLASCALRKTDEQLTDPNEKSRTALRARFRFRLSPIACERRERFKFQTYNTSIPGSNSTSDVQSCDINMQ